ncbi:post-transcriptional regulator [Paenibacillus sp. S-38]|uniref:post-transcriptional regulator n=1 Tax=Paenibacillus sp. S-38 TaxID=3416710 RepID=UPI003CF87BC2
MDKDIWKQDRSSSTEPDENLQDGVQPPDHQAEGAAAAGDTEEQEDAAPRREAEGNAEDVPYMERYYAAAESAASLIREDVEDAAAQEEPGEPLHGPEAAPEPETEAEVPSYEEDPSIPLIERAEAYAGEAEPETMDDDELSLVIEEMCRSKAEEFHMLGYEHVTPEDIWDCVSDKYRKSGVPPLHRIVNDILSLRVTNFMNWLTMSAFKGAHFR